jgi:hypothetical protein
VTLEDRLFDAAIQTRAAGLFRLAAELRRLSEDVRRCRERDVDLAPMASLRAAAHTFALVAALRCAPDDLALRGQARESFEKVGELALIGCGYEIWRTPAGARGATAHFYAPSQRQWFSASLARAAGQNLGFMPEEAVQRDPVWGATLARLAASRVMLSHAAASPGGRLSLGREVSASLQPVELRREELRAWEGSFEDWGMLDVFIRAGFAPTLRSMRQGTEAAVLLPARTGRPAFDEVAQELVLPLADRGGRRLEIRVANLPHLERRLMALQEILASKSPEAFFVTLAVSGERLHISPYALLLEAGGTPQSLDAPRTGPEQPDLRTLADWLRREIAQLTDRTPSKAARGRSSAALTASLDALLGLCELGGQMRDPGLLARLRAQAALLESGGLRPVAQLLSEVVAADEPERPQAVLVAVHALAGLQQLLRLPIT